jgi:hypothetical protein
MERPAITGRLQNRTPLAVEASMLCVIEEKRAHPLSLSRAGVFSDNDDKENRNECNGCFYCERAEKVICT